MGGRREIGKNEKGYWAHIFFPSKYEREAKEYWLPIPTGRTRESERKG